MDKETVDKAKEMAGAAYKRLQCLKPLYEAAERDYAKKSQIFQDLDLELAQTDGRLKKIPPGGRRAPRGMPELTLEQLKDIAAKLGVNISVEEPEEEEVSEDETEV